jgi:hypothetical protein
MRLVLTAGIALVALTTTLTAAAQHPADTSAGPDGAFVAGLALLASGVASSSIGLATADWERREDDPLARAVDRAPVIASATIGLVSMVTLGRAASRDADVRRRPSTPSQVIGQCLATVGAGVLAGGGTLLAQGESAALPAGLALAAGGILVGVGIPLWFTDEEDRAKPKGPLGPPPAELLIGPIGAVIRWRF